MAQAGFGKESQHQNEEFQRAANYLQCKANELDSTQLLYFYARYKQAIEGPCNAPKPGFFNFQAKEKYNAWKELGEMSRQEAMNEYVLEMSRIYPDFDDTPATKGNFGPAVSVLLQEPQLAAGDKTVFDYVKENLSAELRAYLDGTDVNQTDEEGLALLHWACDRGFENIVDILVKEFKADLNVCDESKQTPLHYASSCGHASVVEYLLRNGADVNAEDDEGQTPKDAAINDNIKSLFH